MVRGIMKKGSMFDKLSFHKYSWFGVTCNSVSPMEQTFCSIFVIDSALATRTSISDFRLDLAREKLDKR